MKLDRPALLLVDIQQGFEEVEYWGGHRNNPAAEANAGALLEVWRSNRLPVFHVQHCSSNPQSPLAEGKKGHQIQAGVKPRPAETLIRKKQNSAFIGTGLQKKLEDAGIRQVVVAGLTSDHCVSTTVRMAGNLGFDTYLVEDATATFDKVGPDGRRFSAEILHDTTMASLHGEFATVVKTQQMLELLKNSESPFND